MHHTIYICWTDSTVPDRAPTVHVALWLTAGGPADIGKAQAFVGTCENGLALSYPVASQTSKATAEREYRATLAPLTGGPARGYFQ